MKSKSINPYTNQVIEEHQLLATLEINNAIENAETAFQSWKKTTIEKRCILIKKAGQVLRDRIEEYAQMITAEMGKPITESRAEITKCAWVCDYYAENAAEFLANETIETDADLSFVQNDPLGIILAIMPWNFPFWQVFRFAAPTLTAGNVGLLKHASNVIGCGKLIEDVFIRAGYPRDVFQHLPIAHDEIEGIISNKNVKAVSLTGSEKAGSSVAAIAGKNIKKSLLELGGNNAFIVWEDADIDQAVSIAVNARYLNAGQSCIAAKRFILVDEIHDQFTEKLLKAVSELIAGDPMDKETQIGTLARIDLAETLHKQVQKSIEKGANLLCGGMRKGAFYSPTILSNVEIGMPVFEEETFGPVAAIIRAKDRDHSIELASHSNFGLGATLCTKDIESALNVSHQIPDGAFFVNELVKSDPRLPFGGTKISGFGRELGKDGILEFVNRKTIYVKS